MFGTIRKHQKWLWLLIIIPTIITFVWYFGPTSRVNRGGQRGAPNLGSINGQPVTAEQYDNARSEIFLRYFFASSGTWLDEQEAKRMGLEREIYQRLLLLQKIEEMGIHVNSEVVAEIAKNIIRPFQKAGGVTAMDFVERVLQPRGISLDDFERFVRHELSIQELVSTVGLSGKLVTPQEAKGMYVREHEQLTTEAVFFSATNYLTNVTVAPEAISQFYSNHLAEYRIPERVQVRYVRFALSNFLAKAEEELGKTNLDNLVEVNFQRVGTNYFKDAKTPEETKAKIREELIRGRALSDAGNKAREFARPVFETDPLRVENLEKEASKQGLTLSVTPPFDLKEGPKDLDAGSDFIKAAFSRTAEDPFALVAGHDGVYVIAFDKRLPSEVPPLEQIRDQVVAEYKYEQAVTLARQAGQAFEQTLTNGLAQGKTFEAVCAEAKLKLEILPPFSLSTRELPGVEERIDLNQLKPIAFGTLPGKITNFQPTTAGGIILHVMAKLPPDAAKMQADLPAYMDSLRRSRRDEAFNQWFRREQMSGLRDTPPFQQKPPPALSSRAGKS